MELIFGFALLYISKLDVLSLTGLIYQDSKKIMIFIVLALVPIIMIYVAKEWRLRWETHL